MGLGKTYSTKYLLDSNNSSGVAGQVLISTSTGVNWSDGSDITGGPYLPLSAGSTKPLTGALHFGDAFNYIEKNSSSDMLVVANRHITFSDVISGVVNERMRIEEGGNVGIGETSPDFRLDVSKGYTSGNGKVAKFRSGNDATFVNFDTVQVVQQDVPCLAIIETSTGTQSDEQKLTFAVGDNKAIIGSTSTVTNGMSFYTNRAVTTTGFTAQGNLTLHLSNAGNVGIGTTAPTYKLSVSGGIEAGGVVTYSKSAGSLNTTGYAVAGLTAGFNGASAGFEFKCYGGTGKYQRISYSCYCDGTTWRPRKMIDEGSNTYDVTASADGATITFTFKTRSGTQSYSPRIVVQATGHSINSTYA